ncbi:glycosyltransferase family 2 protein [Anseongella ginsenosidimutans]|nr:glycosyltransferase family 2 protein [Anseongella ginsenosidimutans]
MSNPDQADNYVPPVNLPKVAVVILNWNGQRYLQSFMPSVLASGYPELEIVVGDNASTDDSVAFLERNYPQVRIVKNKSNLGFAGGYNQVLKQVEADYYVLLNSDVEVPPGWIQPVIDLMESDPGIAACQPKIKDYRERDKFEYAGAAGGLMDRFGYLFCRGRIFDITETDRGQYNDARNIFWASGAAFFVRKNCFEQAGGLDEDLFAHMEEADLCWRLQRLGYRIMVCPQSEVYHVGGGTLQAVNAFKTYLNFRNNLILLHQNLPGGKVFPLIFLRFWLDLAAWFLFLFQGRLRHSLAINKAHWHYLRGIGRWQRKRKRLPFVEKVRGIYSGSIVFQHFIKGKKYFSELKYFNNLK